MRRRRITSYNVCYTKLLRHRVAATPEILATHATSAPIEGPGVAARRLPLELRASKFAASFILQTGENAGIYLEYDRGLIRNNFV